MNSNGKRKLEQSSSISKKRTQCYRMEYTERYPCISPSSNETRVCCTVCSTEFGIGSGGADDIQRHVEGPWHKKKCDDVEKSKQSNKTDGYLMKAPGTTISKLEGDVISAEAKMVGLVVELNLPMSSLDSLSKGVKSMFHDSQIAKSFQCARSKGAAIAKEMSALTVGKLVKRLKTQCFTISTDRSNDKAGEKLFPLVVRTVNPDTMEVRSDALSVPAIEGSATGGACLPFSPSQLLFEVFYYLDKSSKRQSELKCCQLYHDMKDQKILKHVCARWLSIGHCLPRLICSWEALYSFFKKEETALKDGNNTKKKVRDLKHIFGSTTNKLYCMFLKYAVEDFEAANTRLQADQPLVHLLRSKLRQLFKATLIKFFIPFFKKEETTLKDGNNTKKKVRDLKHIFGSTTNKLYCMFLKYAVEDFEAANTRLQADQPLVHLWRSKLRQLFKATLIKFVEPSALDGIDILEVGFLSGENMRDPANIIIGDPALELVLGNTLRKERLDDFYRYVVPFYRASCSYMKKKLPLADPLLKHIKMVNPAKQKKATFTDMLFFLQKFPNLIGDSSLTTIQTQFSTYQSTDTSHLQVSTHRADTFWFKIGQIEKDGKFLFPQLSSIMRSLLTIPHSSAHCERIFSVVRKNKTDFRASMSRETLEALIVAKSRPGDALKRSYTKDELKSLKSAYYMSVHKNKL